jgi:hypothetical protein
MVRMMKDTALLKAASSRADHRLLDLSGLAFPGLAK